jgi:hypothetical protein
MTADQIRHSAPDSQTLRDDPNIRSAFIADMLQEMAAQLAEANQIARLKLKLDLAVARQTQRSADSTTMRFPMVLAKAIEEL